jgi:hypothetical protein
MIESKEQKKKEDEEDLLLKVATPEERAAIKLLDYYKGCDKFVEIVAWVFILIPYVAFIHVMVLLCRQWFGY